MGSSLIKFGYCISKLCIVASDANGATNALTNPLISHKTRGFPMSNGFKNSLLAIRKGCMLDRV